MNGDFWLKQNLESNEVKDWKPKMGVFLYHFQQQSYRWFRILSRVWLQWSKCAQQQFWPGHEGKEQKLESDFLWINLSTRKWKIFIRHERRIGHYCQSGLYFFYMILFLFFLVFLRWSFAMQNFSILLFQRPKQIKKKNNIIEWYHVYF